MIYLGWREIKNVMGLSMKSIKGYQKKFGLPILYLARRPITSDGLLEAWLANLMQQELLEILPYDEEAYERKFVGYGKRFGKRVGWQPETPRKGYFGRKLPVRGEGTFSRIRLSEYEEADNS